MKRHLAAIFAMAALAATVFAGDTAISASAWEIDPAHSSAQFSVRHLMVSNVRGEFSRVSGVVRFDPVDITKSTVEATIPADSISTREPRRDAHLKSADFFDVARYPVLTFRSKRVARTANGNLQVVGDLSLHGVTREVTLDLDGPTPVIKDPWGNSRFGVSARTRINRKDFGLAWNQVLETGGVAVGDEVAILLDIEAVQKK